MEWGTVMASKRIAEKVKDFLAGESAEYVDQYYSALLDNFHRLDEKFHRAILLLLFSVASFELLANTAIVEAALGPFKLTDLGLLQKYCPVVIAYSYCSISSLGTMRHYMRDLTAAVIAIRHESVAKNSLDVFLQPPSLFLTSEISQKFSDGVLSSIFLQIESILVFVLTTGPIVFLAYAFYRCFLSFGFRDVNLWVSLSISFVLVFQAVLLFVHHFLNMSPVVEDGIGSERENKT
jgi:hypothetical protein